MTLPKAYCCVNSRDRCNTARACSRTHTIQSRGQGRIRIFEAEATVLQTGLLPLPTKGGVPVVEVGLSPRFFPEHTGTLCIQ